MKKSYLIAQSGGPTTAINASLIGVVNALLNLTDTDKIYGSQHGIQGVLKENFITLSTYSPEELDRIKFSPAMYLGSCRYRLNEDNADEYTKIFDIFKRYNIDTFFYIGGNDSMDTVMKLNRYAANNNIDIRIIGIPKTIDNDLLVTDHTPGFGSAVKYVASTIREIAYDTHIYDLQNVLIVEIMGRDSGWLTAATALARNEYITAPDLIYLPEIPFSITDFLEDIKSKLLQQKQVVVAVSEGIKDNHGHYIAAGVSDSDQFGHSQLSGAGKVLEYVVKEHLHVKVRSVELNVLQRCSSHMSSLADLTEAHDLGAYAVKLARENQSGKMPILVRESDGSFSISATDVENVANKAKYVPLSWINDMGNNITNEMIEYLKPLPCGEIPLHYNNGILEYVPFV